MDEKTKNTNYKLNAFSMNEVLVVLVIVGILSTIAVVSFSDYVAGAYRLEAETNLNAIHTRQRSYHMKSFSYSNDLSAIRFSLPKKEQEGGTSVYSYEIVEATETSYLAQATADKDYDGDGVKEVITIDQEGKITVKIED